MSDDYFPKNYKISKDAKGVITVSLHRPELHNAFNSELIADLIDVFKVMDTDPSVRMVILAGDGKSFCAGADLNWMRETKSFTQQENYRDSTKLAEMFHVINNFSKPLIGKIHGAALGGGSGLVAVCDYVIAEKNTKFAFSETRLGLVPAVISPFVIAKIGESNARAFFLSGKRFDAKTAQRINLIHEVATADELDDAVEAAVDELLLAGADASKMAKKLIRNVIHISGEGPDAVTEYTCQTIAQIRVGDEAQEGMSALLEKRKPDWVVKLDD